MDPSELPPHGDPTGGYDPALDPYGGYDPYGFDGGLLGSFHGLTTVLAVLSGLVKLWMIVDAVRSRAETFWFIVIVFAPFGEWIYFFVVKIHDLRSPALRALTRLERPPSVADLRVALDRTPSAANRMALGHALVEAGEAEEAEALFREVLARNDREKGALLGLGKALLARDRFDDAERVLDELVGMEPGYADGAARLALIDARWRDGRRDRALDDLKELARDDGRIRNHVLLADHLRELGETGEGARAVVARALEDFKHQPGFVRKRDRADARAARQLLKQL